MFDQKGVPNIEPISEKKPIEEKGVPNEWVFGE